MDVKYINPFMDAFLTVIPQIGFKEVVKKGVSLKEKNVKSTGVMVNVGVVGDVKGNVLYVMATENAKKIASAMMMGFPVDELNDMAQSAISELTNMITANAAINFSNMGIDTNISTPTLIYGNDIEVKLSTDKLLCIDLLIDNIPMQLNIAMEDFR